MPIKKTGSVKSNSKNPKDWVSYDFVNMTLNEAQKEQFKEWYKDAGSTAFDELEGLIPVGYKVSIAYDESNKCFISTLTCKEPTDPNYGFCLSSRGPDIWTSLALNVFKTVVLCTDCDWPKEQRTNDFG